MTLAPEVPASPCGHGYKLRFCRECHRAVCDSRHDAHRGWGCDDNDHEHCSGFTRGYETWMCDCICCCRSWPTPKPSRVTSSPAEELENGCEPMRVGPPAPLAEVIAWPGRIVEPELTEPFQDALW